MATLSRNAAGMPPVLSNATLVAPQRRTWRRGFAASFAERSTRRALPLLVVTDDKLLSDTRRRGSDTAEPEPGPVPEARKAKAETKMRMPRRKATLREALRALPPPLHPPFPPPCTRALDIDQ